MTYIIMNLSRIMTVLGAALLLTSLVACAKSFDSSSQDYGDPVVLSELDQISLQTSKQVGGLIINFDVVALAQAEQLEAFFAPPCSSSQSCVELAAEIIDQDIVQGFGEISTALNPSLVVGSPNDVYGSLAVSVSFDDSIANGSACLQTALNAAIQWRGLKIVGDGLLIPLYGQPACPITTYNGPSLNAGCTIASGAELGNTVAAGESMISSPGSTVPPRFTNYVGVVVLTSIDSCVVGDPIPLEPD